MTESTDPYLYPGTDVLKNLRDIRDSDILARFEAEATSRRIIELINSPVAGRFDTAQLKAIHKYIFQDVYAWAGQFRTVNISKGGHPFGAAAFVEPALNDLLQKLSAENYLQALDSEVFASRTGFFLGEINAVHPFREGNGRTQREFIRELGLHAGFVIDWSPLFRAGATGRVVGYPESVSHIRTAKSASIRPISECPSSDRRVTHQLLETTSLFGDSSLRNTAAFSRPARV